MKKEVREIVKEDLIEALGREDKPVSVAEIEPEIKVSKRCITKGIEVLEEEGLLRNHEGYLSLTEKGATKAKQVIEKHSVLEKYFREHKTKKKAREAAGILEHYVSMEVIDSIRKLSTLDEGKPLTEVEEKEVLITDITLDVRMFERIVSMGIFPGTKIRVSKVTPNGLVVQAGNKKLVLAEELASGVEVVKYERG